MRRSQGSGRRSKTENERARRHQHAEVLGQIKAELLLFEIPSTALATTERVLTIACHTLKRTREQGFTLPWPDPTVLPPNPCPAPSLPPSRIPLLSSLYFS